MQFDFLIAKHGKFDKHLAQFESFLALNPAKLNQST